MTRQLCGAIPCALTTLGGSFQLSTAIDYKREEEISTYQPGTGIENRATQHQLLHRRMRRDHHQTTCMERTMRGVASWHSNIIFRRTTTHCVLSLIRVETLVPVRPQLAAVGGHNTGGEALRVKVMVIPHVHHRDDIYRATLHRHVRSDRERCAADLAAKPQQACQCCTLLQQRWRQHLAVRGITSHAPAQDGVLLCVPGWMYFMHAYKRRALSKKKGAQIHL